MRLPHFSLSRFGAVSILKKQAYSMEPISAYEFEFYTEDWPGGTMTDGVFCPARTGYYSLYRPGQRQQLIPPYKCWFINFLTDDAELCDFFEQLPPSGVLWNMEAVVKIIREMAAAQDKDSLEGRLWLEGCACRVLSLLAEQRPGLRQGAILHREELMAADRYMREHLAGDLSLERLARMSNLDPTYFHKLFTGAYGVTPAQRVLAYRIAAARLALADGQLSLGEIAARCGFSSQAYFCSRFKQATGRTPTAFRQRMLNGDKK